MRKIDGTPAKSDDRSLVLYVEDEADNWDVARLRLEKRYQLLWARTDQEAVTLMDRFRVQLAAILMDIELKGSALNGIDLMKLARGTLASVPSFAASFAPLEVPIIFVTAQAANYTEAQLLSTGANRLITKPVNFAELSIALANLSLSKLLPKK